MSNENSQPPSIDPWGSSLVGEEEYEMLIEEFGIERIDDLNLPYSIYEKNRFFRRKIIFGHRDFKTILNAIEYNKPWAVMSGIKPSGHFHLGTLTTASEIVEFQKMGGKVYYSIADLESFEDNGMSFKQSFNYAVDNLADILTLGLDPENAYIWLQSREPMVRNMPFVAGKHVTPAMLKAMYGERPFSLYMAALVQVGDILLPQLLEEAMPTVVPVGIDQDPHLRLVRDLTRFFYQPNNVNNQSTKDSPKQSNNNKDNKKDKNKSKDEGIPFFKPAATYHKLMPGLDDISKKMSKSRPNSYFNLDDEPKLIRKKIMSAYTGGRRNKEEQEKLGGQPDKCMIYKILEYHFEPDDQALFDRKQRCLKGMLCGTCKKEAAKIILDYVETHNEKKKEMIPIAKEILSRKQEIIGPFNADKKL